MTESDKIAAKGIPITLADGSTTHARFGLWGIKIIEDRYGSLAEMQSVMEAAFDTDETGAPRGKAFSTLLDVLGIALLHTKKSGQQLADMLDPRRIEEYVEAVSEALLQSLPDPGPAPKGAKKQAGKSRGATSGTSPRLSAVAPMSNSGK